MNILFGIIFTVAMALLGSALFRGLEPSMLFNPDALIIVCGGTAVAIFLAFPFHRIRSTILDVAGSFRRRRSRADLSRDLYQIARLYRKTDIRGLEKRMGTMTDEYLRMGVNLLINHHSNESIRNVMEREMDLRVMHFNFSQNVMKTAARLTPSFGLAGTVISLIRMFREIQSPDAIAPVMAVAMMSTFYGVVL